MADVVRLVTLVLVIILYFTEARREVRPADRRAETVHYHRKRHMVSNEIEGRKRSTTQRPREMRKKPSGHLTPIDVDDMDNDEVISVAIGPPPIRPKYDKIWKPNPKPAQSNTPVNYTAVNLIKDVISEIGKEFLTRQVGEDFVFGQYVGNAMRNLTSENKLKMQHAILDLVVKYQNDELNKDKGEAKEKRKEETKEDNRKIQSPVIIPVLGATKVDKKNAANETEDWPDFTNLAKIVG